MGACMAWHEPCAHYVHHVWLQVLRPVPDHVPESPERGMDVEALEDKLEQVEERLADLEHEKKELEEQIRQEREARRRAKGRRVLVSTKRHARLPV